MNRWERIRSAYLAQPASAPELAKRFHVPAEEISQRISGWDRERRKNKMEQIADALLQQLEIAAGELSKTTVSCREKNKTESGEEVREYTLPGPPGMVDRGGLKQLTGVLKDIKEILNLSTEAEEREQEARIARLEQDLQQVGQKISVTLEKEMQEYAE